MGKFVKYVMKVLHNISDICYINMINIELSKEKDKETEHGKFLMIRYLY